MFRILPRNRAFRKNGSELDYLVYSSHKTATQSITQSLISNGFNAKHAHILYNIGIRDGTLKRHLEKYQARNQTKLQVISVFRLPMERHISSFFQIYGTRPIERGEVKDASETPLYNTPISELQAQFCAELKNKSFKGCRESLHEFFEELKVTASDIAVNKHTGVGLYETELFKLHLIRFDMLKNNMQPILQSITGREQLPIVETNVSQNDWYKDIYTEFKSSLKVPKSLISAVHEEKRDLINLFYDNGFEQVFSEAVEKYA